MARTAANRRLSTRLMNEFRESEVDPYIYPDTSVLRNKLGITDYKELNAKEKELLKDKILTPEMVKGKKMDSNLLRAIHKYYFEDLFGWAGKYRVVRLFKTEVFFIPMLSVIYAEPENIGPATDEVIRALNTVRWKELTKEELVKEFVSHLVRLWKVHPFRDGNTRAILGFAKVYAIEHGFPMDMSVFTSKLSRPLDEKGQVIGLSVRDMFVGACLDEAPEPEMLIELFTEAMK